MKYILLNNNSPDSVGGQNTYIDRIDIKNLAKSISFQSFISIGTKTNMKKLYKFLSEKKNWIYGGKNI